MSAPGTAHRPVGELARHMQQGCKPPLPLEGAPYELPPSAQDRHRMQADQAQRLARTWQDLEEGAEAVGQEEHPDRRQDRAKRHLHGVDPQVHQVHTCPSSDRGSATGGQRVGARHAL